MQFVFSKVLTDAAVPLEIGNYLRSGVVDTGNLIIEQYVLGNGRLFVISRTIKTSKFTVQTEQDRAAQGGLDVPPIQSVANGHLKVDTSAVASGTVAYEGDKNLIFGFECFEVGVVDGKLSITSTRSGPLALADGAPASVLPTMLGDGNLLNLTGI